MSELEDSWSEVARIWEGVTGDEGDDQVREVLMRRESLVTAPASLVREAAANVYRRLTRLPVNEWADEVERLSARLQIAMRLVPGDLSVDETVADRVDAANRQPTQALAERAVEQCARFGWFQRLDSTVAQEAVARLRQRAGSTPWADKALLKRPKRWSRPPSLHHAVPCLEVDEPERVIVALLAHTYPDAQFSSSPRGDVWPGYLRGYHKEPDRTYVSGLSDILDTSAAIVAEHRANQGGRFYVGASAIECAECRSILAWSGPEMHAALTKRCTGVRT